MALCHPPESMGVKQLLRLGEAEQKEDCSARQ